MPPHPSSPSAVVAVVSDSEETPSAPTVRSRLAVFFSDERIAAHLERKVILLGGDVVTDLDQAAPMEKRLIFGGS